MPRDIQLLLKKYETRDVNEIWTNKHNVEFMRNVRTKEKENILKVILNKEFRVQPNQRERMEYLTKTLDFTKLGPWKNEQIIIMIIIYTKLEANPKNHIGHYKRILNRYELTLDSFIGFLVTLNKHHIKKIPLPNNRC